MKKNVDKVLIVRRFFIDDPEMSTDVCCIEIYVNGIKVTEFLWDEQPYDAEAAWVKGYICGRRLKEDWYPESKDVADWSD